MTPELLQKKMKHRKITIPDKNIIENTFFETLGLGLAIVRLDRPLALLWSNLRPENQRTVKKASLSRICESLNGGYWNSHNGETIKFDRTGSMVDGQHRVDGVVKTGVEMVVPVWYGCDAEAISTIDTGSARTLGDILKINGFSNCTKAASIVNNILSFEERGQIQSAAACTGRALDWAKAHSAELYTSLRVCHSATPYIPISVGGMLHYYYNRVSKTGTKQMFGEFKSGTGRSNAIDLLKNTMSTLRAKSGLKVSSMWKTSIAIKAFNAYFIGDDIKQLRWNRSESAPQIIDVWM